MRLSRVRDRHFCINLGSCALLFITLVLATFSSAFAQTGRPTIAAAITTQGPNSSGAYVLDVRMTNQGTGVARSVHLDSIVLRTLTGTGTVSLNTTLSPALPVNLGDIAIGASATVRLFVNIPATAARFSITENGGLRNPDNTTANFSLGQSVIPIANKAPVANAGTAQTVTLPATAPLTGTVSDDGLPIGGNLSTTWSKLSGPGTVSFADANSRATSATFSTAGPYVLRLTGSDGLLTTTSDVAITVNAAANPTLVSVSPVSAQQGQKPLVTIVGQNTHFVQGTTAVSFGSGITINSVSVSSPTSLTAQTDINNGASVGFRTLTVTTGAETVALNQAFSVTPGTPIITSFDPNMGRQGTSQLLQVNGSFTNFVQGTTQVSLGAGITVNAVTVLSSSTLTATVDILTSAAFGVRALTVTTGSEVVTLDNFSVTGAPSLTSVTRNTVQPGQSLTVGINGAFTNFADGVTQVDFGAGVTVRSITVSTLNTLSAQIDISTPIVLGFHNLIVTTGSESVALNNALSIVAGPTINLTVDRPPNPAGWYNGSVTVSFNCGDAFSGIATCPPPITLSTEGANQSVSGTAINNSGIAVSASLSLNLDRTPPTIVFASPGNGSTVYTTNVTLKGTVADSLSGLTGVTCDSGSAVISGAGFSCGATVTVGVNSFSATVKDVAGNTATATLSLSFLPVPHITLSSPQNLSYTNITPATVTGTLDDPTATITVNSIKADVFNGAFSIALPLAEGPNVITTTATSAAGAVGTASIEVNLDTTPPHLTITSPPDQFVTTDASISVAGSINDIVVGTVNDQQAQVTINGLPAQVANRTFLATTVPLNMGVNLIQAIGRDRVGNFVTQEIHVVRQTSTRPIIKLLSGNNQSGVIGSQLPAPLVVALVDANGNPVPNKPVIFKVTQNDGLIGTPGMPSALLTTNAQGQAQVPLTLGHRAGAGGNTIEAYSVDFDGTAIFTATGNLGPVGKIVVDTGNDQIGMTGQPLPKPLIAVVIDDGNNRLGGVPVTFTVVEGGGSFAGQPSYTVVSDSDGRVAGTLTLGMQEGNGNNLVRASFPNNQSFPASFKASGRAPGDPAKTTISGVVLDNSNLPITGVTVRAVSTSVLHSNLASVQSATAVQTNAQGQFSIPQAAVGLVKLLVDGSTAQAQGQYPSLEYDLVTIPGQDNTVGNSIYLLPLNSANQLCVTVSTGGGTLTIPEAPGFSLTFSPGQVTFPGGSKTGCVSVTAVHGDKVPMAPGFGQQPRFIVTIQPAGAVFNPPAPITLPNVDGLAPRGVTEMYSYDHDISAFVAIGTGVVSDDGRVIRSSSGVGVLKAGWHCGGNSTAVGSAGQCGYCATCVNDECQAAAGPVPSGAPVCKTYVCSNGSPTQIADDSQVPSQAGVEACQKYVCLGGSPTSVGDASQDNQGCTDKFNATVSDVCTAGVCKGKQIKVIFTKFKSEQFPGSAANYLPGGAGTTGNAGKFILMAGRADLRGYVSAEFTVTPDTDEARGRLLFAIRNLNTQEIGAVSGAIGNKAFVSSGLLRGSVDDFTVVAGVDENNNAAIDPEEVVSISSPGVFRVVPRAVYFANRDYFLAGGVGAQIFLGQTIAAEFNRAFLLGTTPLDAVKLPDTANASSLEHAVGVVFNNGEKGPLPMYLFRADSYTANTVLASTALKELFVKGKAQSGLSSVVPRHASEVLSYFATPGSADLASFGPYCGDDSITFGAADNDLGHSHGGAVLENTCITLHVQRQSDGSIQAYGATVTGALTDTYDWDWNKAGYDQMLAYVQAGFGTYGAAGEVFRSRVEFSGEITLSYKY